MPTALPPGRRAALLVGGTLLSTLCFAVTIRARMGLGPLFAVQDGLTRVAHLTMGQAVIVVGLAFVGLAWMAGHRPGIGTLLVPVVGGLTIDAMVTLVPPIHGASVRLVVVVVATWLMGLGGVLIVEAALGVAAIDGVMLGLQRIVGLPVGGIRVAMEAVMLVVGWWLGGAVGVGTVLTGLLIGPAMQFWFAIARRCSPTTTASAADAPLPGADGDADLALSASSA